MGLFCLWLCGVSGAGLCPTCVGAGTGLNYWVHEGLYRTCLPACLGLACLSNLMESEGGRESSRRCRGERILWHLKSPQRPGLGLHVPHAKHAMEHLVFLCLLKARSRAWSSKKCLYRQNSDHQQLCSGKCVKRHLGLDTLY